MLNNMTLDKMRSLRLFGMLEAFEHVRQTQSLQTLSFTEGLSLLVDQEALHRDNKRLAKLSKIAKLRYPQAMIEDINFEHKRAIAPEQLQWLISGQWLLNQQNILLIGPTGIGKTFLACACASLACRRGFNTRYFRLSKLLEAMRIAHADGSYSRLTAQLLKAQCLVIDDWGIDPITPERRADLLEIIDDRYDQRSIIIASQLPIDLWHDYIGDQTIADAMLDRIVHRAKIFKLMGESMRKTIASS
jgi:DNA replication protein DnaC